MLVKGFVLSRGYTIYGILHLERGIVVAVVLINMFLQPLSCL